MHIRRFYLSPENIAKYSNIMGEDVFYITHVLRMNIGQYIEIFDGSGNNYLARIIYISYKIVQIKIIKSLKSDTESLISITLAQSVLKEKKMDVLIRQLTELGIRKWLPFRAKRSIPITSKNKIISKITRWRNISIAAVKQCHRGIIPQIFFAKDLDEILTLSKFYDISIILWEKQLPDFKLTCQKHYEPKKILIIIGPEGGFELDEIERATAKGFIISSLGPRILRTETASLVICSIVQYLFGDIGKKHLTF